MNKNYGVVGYLLKKGIRKNTKILEPINGFKPMFHLWYNANHGRIVLSVMYNYLGGVKKWDALVILQNL